LWKILKGSSLFPDPPLLAGDGGGLGKMNPDRLLEERKIAQSELERCSRILWAQAQFFLTLNTAALGAVAYLLQGGLRVTAVFLCVAGLFTTAMWLLHGNRIGVYIQATEERIQKVEEQKDFVLKIALHQKERITTKAGLKLLERVSSMAIVKTALPLFIMALWVALLIFSAIPKHTP